MDVTGRGATTVCRISLHGVIERARGVCKVYIHYMESVRKEARSRKAAWHALSDARGCTPGFFFYLVGWLWLVSR
jgi:hypothetical protein